ASHFITHCRSLSYFIITTASLRELLSSDIAIPFSRSTRDYSHFTIHVPQERRVKPRTDGHLHSEGSDTHAVLAVVHSHATARKRTLRVNRRTCTSAIAERASSFRVSCIQYSSSPTLSTSVLSTGGDLRYDVRGLRGTEARELLAVWATRQGTRSQGLRAIVDYK
ncbi:unnamed protein product, partial [Rhizoctonia solani]